MTLGHLFLPQSALSTSSWRFQFEERDLISYYGDTYRQYARKYP
jgi:protein-S-isoprenylcysteine O-methyltransferase Ste14